MVSFVHPLRANQKQVEVDLFAVPHLLPATRCVLENDLFTTLPPTTTSARGLRSRIEKIEKLTKVLPLLKEKPSTASKILALVMTAVVVGGLAGSIFLTVTVSPYFGIAIGAFGLTLLGSFVELADHLTRESRAKNQLAGYKASLQQALESLQADVEKGYPWAQEVAGSLQERLNNRIHSVETSLAQIAECGEVAPQLQSRLKVLWKAREELGALVHFYQQFN